MDIGIIATIVYAYENGAVTREEAEADIRAEVAKGVLA